MKAFGGAVVLFSVVVLVCGRTTGLQCPPESECDAAKECSSEAALVGKCSSEWTVDECGCCRNCVREEVGLPCGGSRKLGVCKAPLECIADLGVGRLADDHEEGTCHERNCSALACPTTSSRSCPEDSYALPSLSSPRSCCPISQGCACLPNDCLWPDCPPDTVRRLVKKGNRQPGSCCDAYECIPAGSGDGVCRVGKETYKTNETWQTKCSSCSCRNGVANCNDHPCKGVDVHCSWLHKPDGDCCPVCLGCLTSSGLRFNNSERWKEDDCTWCECVSGKAKCETQMCQTKCPNPVKQPGVCCPVCEKTASPGSSVFHVGANRTSPSTRVCGQDDRSVWRDQCRHCACLNGREVCSLVACPRTYCEHPVMEPGACCPVCQNDVTIPFRRAPVSAAVCQGLDGHIHREGDSWWLDDCTQCVCVDGFAMCESTPCPAAPCALPVRKQGQCCPVCNEEAHLGGNSSNQLPCVGGLKDGQSWRSEPCLSCLCQAGKERCFRETCPPTTCLEPLYLKNRCCPICPVSASKPSPSCRTDGKSYPDGSWWSPDNCKRCHCTQGQVHCSEMGCPAGLCRSADHASGSCCIPCTEGSSRPSSPLSATQCALGKLVLSDGEHRALDNCNRCQCDRGRLLCRETVCHQDLCRTRNHTSGNCCTQCRELGHGDDTKVGPGDVGYIVAIVFLVVLLISLFSYNLFQQRRKHRAKGFNKARQPYQKTPNGHV
ncbi:cysteine-rich motor neuron 1 protein [Ixodes scapularis]|uniref:cysteine-rich motor neuron 1 protein n=1 Tax=Ixodes scapularis TaxID=6945 RepID=UPI001C393626|nr:cysteine-rich motor neuron 1 protein [Ixodes scapularis]